MGKDQVPEEELRRLNYEIELKVESLPEKLRNRFYSQLGDLPYDEDFFDRNSLDYTNIEGIGFIRAKRALLEETVHGMR